MVTCKVSKKQDCLFSYLYVYNTIHRHDIIINFLHILCNIISDIKFTEKNN